MALGCPVCAVLIISQFFKQAQRPGIVLAVQGIHCLAVFLFPGNLCFRLQLLAQFFAFPGLFRCIPVIAQLFKQLRRFRCRCFLAVVPGIFHLLRGSGVFVQHCPLGTGLQRTIVSACGCFVLLNGPLAHQFIQPEPGCAFRHAGCLAQINRIAKLKIFFQLPDQPALLPDHNQIRPAEYLGIQVLCNGLRIQVNHLVQGLCCAFPVEGIASGLIFLCFHLPGILFHAADQLGQVILAVRRLLKGADPLLIFSLGKAYRTFQILIGIRHDQKLHGFIQSGHPQLTQKFPFIGLRILRILIQRPVKISGSLGKVPILQVNFAPLEQRRRIAALHLLHHRLMDHRLMHRLVLAAQLHHAPGQILQPAQLAHVLGLQIAEFLGNIVGINALVAGDQRLLPVRFHHVQEPAPFVFHPHRIKIFIIRADGQHHPGRMQRSKNVGLILLAQFVFQRDPGKEHLQPLGRQGIVNILGQHAVRGTAAGAVRFLVADEHIIRLFPGHNAQDIPLQTVNFLGLFPVDFLRHGIRIFAGHVKIAVIHDGGLPGAVAGGHLFAGGRVIHIFDAVGAQAQAPIGLCLFRKFRHNGFIHRCSLVKFRCHAQPVGPVEQVQFLFVIHLRDGLCGAAKFALAHRHPFLKLQIPAAHFAFDDHLFCSFGVPLYCNLSVFRQITGRTPAEFHTIFRSSPMPSKNILPSRST